MIRYLNIQNVFVFLSLLVALFATGLLIYFMAFEQAYLSYQVLPIEVLKKSVYPGDILPIKVTRCNATTKKQVFTTTRFLSNAGSDQEVIVLAPIGIIVPPGCVTIISRFHRIPESTLPGRYQISGTVSIPGIIRHFSVDWYTQSFDVLERPPIAAGSPGTQSGVQ